MGDFETRNDRTLFVGNLERSCKEEILYELFLQAGPLNDIKIAKERDGAAKGYAFVEYKHDISVPYALHLLNGTLLCGRQLSLKFRNGSKHEESQYQGPPAQAFPKGFPDPSTYGGPPHIQRTYTPLPVPIAPPNYTQARGYRGSPGSESYGSPLIQVARHNFHGGHSRQSYDDTRPSSRGPFRGTPPGSRDQSPRWEGHDRRGNFENQATERRHGHGERMMETGGTLSGGHHGREGRYHSREDDRHRSGRERSRTVDDHQRGHNEGHQFRERSMEDFNRRSSGQRSNDGYRQQHSR